MLKIRYFLLSFIMIFCLGCGGGGGSTSSTSTSSSSSSTSYTPGSSYTYTSSAGTSYTTYTSSAGSTVTVPSNPVINPPVIAVVPDDPLALPTDLTSSQVSSNPSSGLVFLNNF